MRSRRRVERAERTPPTPETVAKLRPDCLEALNLTPDMEKAADEIKRIVHTVYAGSLVHLAALERFDKGITELPDWIACAHHERFLPWARNNSASEVELVIRVIVDREPESGMHRIKPVLQDYVKRY